MVFPALAGAMGWGIRGQYGHETGAMMAGLLVALTLGALHCRNWPAVPALRAVALMTIGIGFGGSETYGQTVGLTQDAPLTGNWAALGWGMLGLGIKGGLWIAFGGVFLGMGLSGFKYRPIELIGVFAGMIVLMFLGVWLFNQPYDPATRTLPSIYFSDDWRWEPEAILKPRRERWGGLLLALAGLVAYTGWIRRDRLSRNLAGWAFVGGAVGFPLGQSLQAFHAWNRELFSAGLLGSIAPVINWWNLMETAFGGVWGALLGFGLWLNRNRLVMPAGECAFGPRVMAAEVAFLGLYVVLLVCWEFFDIPFLNALAEPGLTMGLIPIVALVSGRLWPFWIVLPVTLVPIAGKTVRRLVYEEQVIGPAGGWLLYLVLPLAVTTALAVLGSAVHRPTTRYRNEFLRLALVLNVWLYFSLNFAFFRYPWPWEAWTVRTPNALIYAVCAVTLTWLALRSPRNVARP